MWGDSDPEWAAGDDAAGSAPRATVPTYRSTSAATGEFFLTSRLHGRVRYKQGFVGALPNPAQLRLAHRALQAKQQPVVELPRTVPALAVDDERVREPAEIQELIPVAIVARQPRDIQADDRAGVPQTDLGHQALEAGSARGGGARLPEVVVDHDDLAPAQAPGVILEIVLPAAALMVVTDLRQRGLADVHEGGPGQMIDTDLLVTGHREPPRGGRRCWRPAAAARPATRRGVPAARAPDRTTEAEQGTRDPAVLSVVEPWRGASALVRVASAPILGAELARTASRSLRTTSASTVTTASMSSVMDAQRSRDVIHSGRKLHVPSASWQRNPRPPSRVRW